MRPAGRPQPPSFDRRPLTGRILTVAETGSTNSDVLALGAAGADEGLWLRAERQTGGRGRQGRVWTSEAGNLFASTLVRRQPNDPPSYSLAFVAALAAHAAVCQCLPAGAGVVIKWPNDLLAGNAKLCGILLEGRDDLAVVGFGVNLAHAPALPDRPATCLRLLGAPADLGGAQLLERLAEQFALWLDRWRGEGLCAILAAWMDAAQPVGTPIRAHLADGAVHEGKFDGLAPDGALLLRLANGAHHAIHAADIFPLHTA